MRRTADLVVRDGTLVTPQGQLRAGVAVADGTIVAIGREDSLPEAAVEVSARDCHVLPGVIDSHVHFREPGDEHKEDRESGTTAAAFGGVTTVLDMPNTRPPTATPEALALKQERAARKAHVDYGLFGLIAQDNVAVLPALAARGVIGFKCYMGETVGRIPAPDDGVMLEVFATAAALGLRVAVHAENNGIMQHLIGRVRRRALRPAGPRRVAAGDLRRRGGLARGRLRRVDAGAAARLSRELRRRPAGGPRRQGARRRRDDGDVPALPAAHRRGYGAARARAADEPAGAAGGPPGGALGGLRDGVIDMLATDHSPHTVEEKTRSDIWQAISGFPGVETAVPLMLTQVIAGRLTLERYVELTSASPARAWGPYPKKGALRVGSDADLVVVDLARRGVVRAEALHSRSKITPFEGMPVQGLPVCTIVRGRVVVRDGELLGTPGWGRPVSPAPVARPAAAEEVSDSRHA